VRWLRERARRVRWLAVPLLTYVTMTVVLPVANGAAARPGFVTHAVLVLTGCVAAVALVIALIECGRLTQRVGGAVRRRVARPRGSEPAALRGAPCDT
jgi:hypothetical protein